MVEELRVATLVPSLIRSSKKRDGTFSWYPVRVTEDTGLVEISYEVQVLNQFGTVGTREFGEIYPSTIIKDLRFFQVMGLLQGELSKTKNRPLTFCNSEPKVIQEVMQWFHNALNIDFSRWKWYVKVNIPCPEEERKLVLEENLLNFWSDKAPVSDSSRYPTAVSYVKTSRRTTLLNKGTLIVETRGQVFLNIVHQLLDLIAQEILHESDEAVTAYLQGVAAAEGCVNYHRGEGHRRVFISACKKHERELFEACFTRLGVEYNDCKPVKDIVISRKKNIERLAELDIFTLHPKKKAKFAEMVNSYSDWWHEARASA